MIRRLLLGFAGSSLFSLSLLAGLRFTFPAGAAADWARYQVQDQSNGQSALEVEAISPWRTGLFARDISLLSVEGEGEKAVGQTVLTVDEVGVRVSLFQLLFGEIAAVAYGQFGDGLITLKTTVLKNEDDLWLPTVVSLNATAFPLNSLPPVQSGGGRGQVMESYQLKGDGTLDLALKLNMNKGLRKANGSFSLSGDKLVVSEIIAPDSSPVGAFDLVTEFDELDILFKIKNGRAKVSHGVLNSNLFNADLSGEVILMNDISRSRLRLQLVFTLGEQLSAFKILLSGALQDDDRYHYRISGTLSKPRFVTDSKSKRRSSRGNNASKPSKARPARNSSQVRADEKRRRKDLETRQEEARQKREETRQRRAENPRVGDARAIVRPKNLRRPASLTARPLSRLIPNDQEDEDYPDELSTENDNEEIDPDYEEE